MLDCLKLDGERAKRGTRRGTLDKLHLLENSSIYVLGIVEIRNHGSTCRVCAPPHSPAKV